MDLLQKSAVMIAGAALSIVGISTSAQAASYTFTIGNFLNNQSGLLGGTLSGSFSGTDTNGDGFLTANELDSFSMSYSGDALIGPQTWNNDLFYFNYLLIGPERFSLSTNTNKNGASASVSIAEFANSSVSSPSSYARSSSYASIEQVPEPDNSVAVFASGVILGLGLLLKKKLLATLSQTTETDSSTHANYN